MSNQPSAPPPLLIPESDDLFGRPTRGTWMMIITMLIVKIGGLIVIFMIDPSEIAVLFAIVSSWLWVVVLGVLLSSPVAFWWRKWRVRSRREELQRAEWMVDSDQIPVDS